MHIFNDITLLMKLDDANGQSIKFIIKLQCNRLHKQTVWTPCGYGRPSWFQIFRVLPGDECGIYLGRGGRLGRRREKYFSPFFTPPQTAICPQRSSPRYI